MWQPIETCPENTWVLVFAPWGDPPQIEASKFNWVTEREWETVSESSGTSGARREVREEKITRAREWESGTNLYDWWMPLPAPPDLEK